MTMRLLITACCMTVLAHHVAVLAQKSPLPVARRIANPVIKSGSKETCSNEVLQKNYGEIQDKGQCTEDVFPLDQHCDDKSAKVCIAALIQAAEDAGCYSMVPEFKDACMRCDRNLAQKKLVDILDKGQCTKEEVSGSFPSCDDPDRQLCIAALVQAGEDSGCQELRDLCEKPRGPYQKSRLLVVGWIGGKPMWQSVVFFIISLVCFCAIFYRAMNAMRQNFSRSISPPQELLG